MKEKGKDSPPKAPDHSTLPPSELIWQGTFIHLCDTHPCRVVLGYRYVWRRGDDQWTAEPLYVYETAQARDAMNEWKWEVSPKTELPAAFFEDVMNAFRKVNNAPRA